MLKFINRIRKFDVRKLSPLQMVVAAAGGIIVLWVIAQLLSLLLTILNFIMPIAASILAAYLAYNWFSSRSEDIPEEAKKSKDEKLVEEALATVQAAQSGEILNLEEEEQEDDEVYEERTYNMEVAQIVNPETGFKEPDISRLIEREQEKLKEADKVNDDVLSQIEERRRRLREKKGG